MDFLFPSQLTSVLVATTPRDRETRQAGLVVQRCQPWFYLRFVVYALLGYPRGHRVFAETWCRLGTCLQAIRILPLEPEHLKKRTATGTNHPRWKVLTRDAQAACNFSFSASKSSPFFQSVSVMAAILRASVSRAMVGLMPLSREAW